MNTLMKISEPNANEYCFFTKLRSQGVPFFTTCVGQYGKPRYVSSKRLIETVEREEGIYDLSRVFYIRERDLPLVMMMSQYRVEVWKSGSELLG